jgi:hypothetical protein
VLTLSVATACTYRLPERVTCESARAIRPGMKGTEVERLIGRPEWGGKILEGRPEGEWHYERSRFWDVGTFRFIVKFYEDVVTEVVSYYSYPWSNDVKYIYRASSTGHFEDPEFAESFRCM